MGYFLPFYPLTAWKMKISSMKNENLKKMKKRPGDIIIILHKCTKNYDHMPYCSWDMAHDTCNFYFSFWAIFCLLTPPPPPLTAWKIKISEKWKKSLEISSFYTSVPQIRIRWCTVPEIWCMTEGQADGLSERRTEKVT